VEAFPMETFLTGFFYFYLPSAGHGSAGEPPHGVHDMGAQASRLHKRNFFAESMPANSLFGFFRENP